MWLWQCFRNLPTHEVTCFYREKWYSYFNLYYLHYLRWLAGRVVFWYELEAPCSYGSPTLFAYVSFWLAPIPCKWSDIKTGWNVKSINIIPKEGHVWINRNHIIIPGSAASIFQIPLMSTGKRCIKEQNVLPIANGYTQL